MWRYYLKHHLQHLWFRDKHEDMIFINGRAVQMRATLLLMLPVYMVYVLYTTVLSPSWQVWSGQTPQETFEMTENFNVLYEVLAYRTVYDFTIPTWVLFYGLFEMLAGMWVRTAYLSPTIHLTAFLTRHDEPKWEPLKPKRFAWTIGAIMITACLLFFNPDSFARFVNNLTATTLLPTNENFMPGWIPLLVYVCLLFMLSEAAFGFCWGCKFHWLLAKLKIFKEECYTCNNVDFGKKQRQQTHRESVEKLAGKNQIK
ncbi:DUF4395 family protein [Hydrogenovibrio halophilus]|uniref:DUF4395 family protein n=1 Tax=Hydrogenovibrio halophilus TaxID=373391 RepID=UPI000364FAE4|nr:DUF4395 family protein [Hydrogenovibrio halophilus]